MRCWTKNNVLLYAVRMSVAKILYCDWPMIALREWTNWIACHFESRRTHGSPACCTRGSVYGCIEDPSCCRFIGQICRDYNLLFAIFPCLVCTFSSCCVSKKRDPISDATYSELSPTYCELQACPYEERVLNVFTRVSCERRHRPSWWPWLQTRRKWSSSWGEDFFHWQVKCSSLWVRSPSSTNLPGRTPKEGLNGDRIWQLDDIPCTEV